MAPVTTLPAVGKVWARQVWARSAANMRRPIRRAEASGRAVPMLLDLPTPSHWDSVGEGAGTAELDGSSPELEGILTDVATNVFYGWNRRVDNAPVLSTCKPRTLSRLRIRVGWLGSSGAGPPVAWVWGSLRSTPATPRLSLDKALADRCANRTGGPSRVSQQPPAEPEA